jgi:uncharacterized membrane protein
MSDAVPVFGSDLPHVRPVPVDRPWFWLGEGWKDLTRAYPTSLAYGAVLVALSYALTFSLFVFDLVYLILPITGGFMMLAPLLAVGLYDVSRRLAAGEAVSLGSVAIAWQRNALPIGAMGAVLLILHLFWIRVAMLLYALFFVDSNPTWTTFLENMLFSPQSLPFLALGTLLGGVLAAIVFAISAVSIPMMLDRDAGLFTALATSLAVVKINWRAMTLWAALIVAFTGFGIVPFYFGLAIALPLVGHATWHAYKDMVIWPAAAQAK